MEFIIRYDHQKYKPSNHNLLKKQRQFKLTILANNLDDAKNKLRIEYNLNPFYFKFNNIKEY